MAKFTVSVIRTDWARRDIEVEAADEEEAEEKALGEAGNHLFSEHDSEYSVDWVYGEN